MICPGLYITLLKWLATTKSNLNESHWANFTDLILSCYANNFNTHSHFGINFLSAQVGVFIVLDKNRE